MPIPKMIGKASAAAPGTCGELCQGLLAGVHCMVTCPIDMYSVATAEVVQGEAEVSGPEDSPKAVRAVQATLDYLQERAVDVRLWLDSPLPRGKGMASSTADVAAAAVATASVLGQELCPEQIAEIALGVEPSDGVMFPHVALFDHRKGRLSRILDPPPSMRVVILDFGGTVDTLEFNRVDKDDLLEQLGPDMERAVLLIEEGLRSGDPGRIGRGATLSAVANQQLLFNPHLDAVLELAQEANAVGVNVAHSGAVIGMLFPDDAMLIERAATLAWRELPGLESVLCRSIVSGGVKRVR